MARFRAPPLLKRSALALNRQNPGRPTASRFISDPTDPNWSENALDKLFRIHAFRPASDLEMQRRFPGWFQIGDLGDDLSPFDPVAF